MNQQAAGQIRFETGTLKIGLGNLISHLWRCLHRIQAQAEERLQQQRADLLKSLSEQGRTTESLAVELGMLRFALNRAVERRSCSSQDAQDLEILLEKLNRAAARLDLRVDDFKGRPLQGELAERCEVLHNVQRQGIQGHVVGETLRPQICLGGKVLQCAEVIGWVGKDIKKDASQHSGCQLEKGEGRREKSDEKADYGNRLGHDQ